MMSWGRRTLIMARIDVGCMSRRKPQRQSANNNPNMDWIGKYQIQPRDKRGRAITVPQAVAPEVGESVVVWSGLTDGNGRPYLRLALGSLSDSVKKDEKFVARQSVVSSGRGSRVAIPCDCSNEHFPVGSQVIIGGGYSDGKLTHLKIVSHRAFNQAISAIV
jgi:hypothetical protein